MPKKKLNQRLDPEVLERLIAMQASQKVSFQDLLTSALDALDREQNLPETLLDRVENLEDAIAVLHRKLEILDEKTASADKIRGLFQIMEKQLIAHDQAEQARFDQLRGTRTEYPGAETEQVESPGTEQLGGAGKFY